MRDALFLEVIKYLFKVFPLRGGLFYFTSTFYCKQQYSRIKLAGSCASCWVRYRKSAVYRVSDLLQLCPRREIQLYLTFQYSSWLATKIYRL